VNGLSLIFLFTFPQLFAFDQLAKTSTFNNFRRVAVVDTRKVGIFFLVVFLLLIRREIYVRSNYARVKHIFFLSLGEGELFFIGPSTFLLLLLIKIYIILENGKWAKCKMENIHFRSILFIHFLLQRSFSFEIQGTRLNTEFGIVTGSLVVVSVATEIRENSIKMSILRKKKWLVFCFRFVQLLLMTPQSI
jgi:hypothetical protein